MLPRIWAKIRYLSHPQFETDTATHISLEVCKHNLISTFSMSPSTLISTCSSGFCESLSLYSSMNCSKLWRRSSANRLSQTRLRESSTSCSAFNCTYRLGQGTEGREFIHVNSENAWVELILSEYSGLVSVNDACGHICLTGIVFAIREVVLCEFSMDGRHLLGEIEGFLIAGYHALRTGAWLVCCRHLQHSRKNYF